VSSLVVRDRANLSPVSDCVDEPNQLLTVQAEGRFRVRVQNPITMNDRCEPQPDRALVRKWTGAPDRHPSSDDVQLTVVVSDTTTDYDREVKLLYCARGGIAEVWLVDLPQRAIEPYRKPKGKRYTHTAMHGRGEEVSPQGVAVTIRVTDLFAGASQGNCLKSTVAP